MTTPSAATRHTWKFFRTGGLDQVTLATGADLVVLSAHKYLAAPTAGLIVGRAGLVQSCRAQERGIGRAMKPTKEAILGVLAALDERRRLDLGAWSAAQQRKVADFVERAARIGLGQSRLVGDLVDQFTLVHWHLDTPCAGARPALLGDRNRPRGIPRRRPA